MSLPYKRRGRGKSCKCAGALQRGGEEAHMSSMTMTGTSPLPSIIADPPNVASCSRRRQVWV